MSATLAAAPASATDPTLTAAGAQAVSESGHIVDFYKTLGVGASNIMQTAAFNSMRASTSGRAAERMMRSYGM